jgi:F-type H+-transporting ATPase subunit delta
MKTERISRVYAEALFELAEKQGDLERVSHEVEVLQSVLRGDPSIRAFLESPSVPSAERERALEGSLRGRLADVLLNFLLLVVRRGRQLYFLQMLEDFRALHDAKVGIVHARATTAVAMTAETRDALRARLEGTLGKRVVLDGVVDEEILGGFVVRFDGMVADASLRRALEDMRASLRNIKLGSELVHED